MKYFFSCDWGNSSLRLYLADAASGRVIFKVYSDEGIAQTFNLWELTRRSEPGERQIFYLNILGRHISRMELQLKKSLKNVPLLLSGMASSSIGLLELPYGELPCSLVSLSGFVIRHLPAGDLSVRDLVLVSGLKSDDEVMRGEETQLLGCVAETSPGKTKLFLLPGTHSKHITVSGRQIMGFKTYMTGELFELLSQQSLLKSGVERTNGWHPAIFRQAVRDAAQDNLLNVLFRVRTNSLWNKLTLAENYSYLSGLLIGSELNDIKNSGADEISLVCGTELKDHYLCALEELALSVKINTFETAWMEEAAARAHFRIYKEIYGRK